MDMNKTIDDLTCQICFKMFTEVARKPVLHDCGYQCCSKCFVWWLKDYNHNMSCMNCNGKFSEDFLAKHTSKHFMRITFTSVIKDKLFKEEQELIPETRREIFLDKARNAIKREMDKYEDIDPIQVYLNEKLQALAIDRFVECTNIDCDEMVFADIDSPYSECSKCTTVMCSKCLMPCSKENHTCDKTIIEDMCEIKKSTIPCPVCGIRVYKVDGCYQVMCTKCNAVFDYNTGKLNRERIVHAVDANNSTYGFIEQSVGKEIYDEAKSLWVLDELYYYWDNTFDNKFYRVFTTNEKVKMALALYINMFAFIKRTVVGKMNHVQLNRELRVRFIESKISEQEFKNSIYKNEISYDKSKSLASDMSKMIFALRIHINKYASTIIKEQGKLIDGAKYVSLSDDEEKVVADKISEMVDYHAKLIAVTHGKDIMSFRSRTNF